MSSISEPSEITGLPDPQVATHAVGMPAKPRSTLKPSFSRMPLRYLRGLELLEAQLAEAEDAIHHDLRLLLHGVDLARQVGLDGGLFLGGDFRLRGGRGGGQERDDGGFIHVSLLLESHGGRGAYLNSVCRNAAEWGGSAGRQRAIGDALTFEERR